MKLLSCLAVTFLSIASLQAGPIVGPWTPIFKGIDRASGTNVPDATSPRLQSVNAMRIDLTDPDVQLFVDPRCTNNCPGETQGNTTSGFLQKYGLQAAINCSFFDPCCSQPVGSSMTIRGLSISRGQLVSQNQSGYLAELLFRTNNSPIFIRSDFPPTNYAGIFMAMAGDLALVTNGVMVQSFDQNPNPRTALGISQDSRYLYLLVIDARQPGFSDGATDNETANWMILLGAYHALNTDGGGSATMVMADCTGRATQLNRPIHAGVPGTERVIANHFGIYAKPLEGFISNTEIVPQANSATINWTTEAEASTQVEYGQTRFYSDITPLDATPVIDHSVRLTGLLARTTYFYRLTSVSFSDGLEYTAEGCFTTTNNAPGGTLLGLNKNWKFSTDNLFGTPWASPDYDDSGWSGGPGLLWADTRVPPNPAIESKGVQMPANPVTTYPYITYYLRTSFTFSNNPAGATLTFSNFLDDGAVFYLNGTEVQRLHLPPPPATILNSTLANSVTCNDATLNCPQVFSLSEDQLTSLVQGTNLLAVEVHNFNSQSPDVTFGCALLFELPPPPPSFIETLTVQPSDTGAAVTWNTPSNSTSQVEYGLTQAGGTFSASNATLVMSHTVILTNLQVNTHYYFRAMSALGANVYSMAGDFTTLPFYRPVLPLEASWKFTTANLDGQNWPARTYAESGWSAGGPALLYVENAPEVVPKNTLLPGTPGSLPPTYYFRTHFQFTGSSAGYALMFSNIVDDGAVFYLNGTEIQRLRMAPRPAAITYTTLATGTPLSGDAIIADFFRISGDLMTNLLSGDNLLAAEVHQATVDSSDIVFGSAVGLVQTLPAETKLRATLGGGSLCISWDGGAGMVLQQSATVGNASGWSDVPGPIRVSPFCTAPPASSRFYRLRN